jgi:hypothetical protein
MDNVPNCDRSNYWMLKKLLEIFRKSLEMTSVRLTLMFSLIFSTFYNIFALRPIFTLWKKQCNQETGIFLTSLDEDLSRSKSPLRLLVLEPVWDELLHTSSSAVNRPARFDESSAYRCLIHAPLFWEPIYDLVSPSRDNFVNAPSYQQVQVRPLFGTS